MIALLSLYLFPKFLIYVLWCYLGLRLFRAQGENWGNNAFLYGLYRLLLGFGFGFVVFIAAAALESNGVNSEHNSTALEYVLVYLPIRWIEWTIMAIVIIPISTGLFRWLSGLNKTDRLWRLGGIAISFIGDASLLFLVKHVEIGRILC